MKMLSDELFDEMKMLNDELNLECNIYGNHGNGINRIRGNIVQCGNHCVRIEHLNQNFLRS